MVKSYLLLILLLVLPSFNLIAEKVNNKILYIYDEVNEYSELYLTYFKDAFIDEGIYFDEIEVRDLKSIKIESYDIIVIHSMVMAFNFKSPVRDWLKTKPDLFGKKVSLFVTANRWFLKNHFGQIYDLLAENQAVVIDAVSMATKTLTISDKINAVKMHVSRLN